MCSEERMCEGCHWLGVGNGRGHSDENDYYMVSSVSRQNFVPLTCLVVVGKGRGICVWSCWFWAEGGACLAGIGRVLFRGRTVWLVLQTRIMDSLCQETLGWISRVEGSEDCTGVWMNSLEPWRTCTVRDSPRNRSLTRGKPPQRGKDEEVQGTFGLETHPHCFHFSPTYLGVDGGEEMH